MLRTFYIALITFVIASFNDISCQQNIPIRIYLEGALINNGGQQSSTGRPLMRDNLRLNPFNNQTSLPSQDPYFYPMANFDISSKFNHVEGLINTSLHNIQNPQALFAVTGENAIVDWVFVQIRSTIDSTKVIATRSGLLQRDGDIVDLDGVSNLHFGNLTAGNYYVSVKHRSHLGVMSKIVNAGTMVDFTNPLTLTYDLGQISPEINYTGLSQKQNVVNWYSALWSGDANCDGRIKADNPNDDISIIHSDIIFDPANTVFLSSYNNAIGYYNSDIDMDGKSKYTSPNDDAVHIMTQAIFYPLNVKLIPNFDLIVEQVPKIQN